MAYAAKPQAFFRTTAPLFGGGETMVGFARHGWAYRLYSRQFQRDGVPMVEDSLLVARPGQAATAQVCQDGGAGFRADLSALPLRAPGF
jgi:hypothetical protein